MQPVELTEGLCADIYSYFQHIFISCSMPGTVLRAGNTPVREKRSLTGSSFCFGTGILSKQHVLSYGDDGRRGGLLDGVVPMAEC